MSSDPNGSRSLLQQIETFPQAFWMLNIMEMLERLAYYGVRVVIPIYIAQADEIGGLHFTQIQKGEIFAWWALVQSLVPMFSGGFADRYGYKKTIAFSIVFKILGYVLMATQREFYPFLFGTLVLAFGTAVFKPGIQGSLVQTLDKNHSSVGWGIFYMLVNIGGFLGPPLAHFLYGISWPAVFYGCAAVVSLNFLTLLTYKEIQPGGTQTRSPLEIMALTFRNILKPKLGLFILIMSGFWLMFMQLFDMLPNFIVDWVDTSDLVTRFSLPSFMTVLTDRGTMITQEWLINANSGLIILFVVFISWLVSRMRRVTSIFIGIAIASFGLLTAGFTMNGYLVLMGIGMFSVGEMLASPKMNEYLGVIAPEGEKGLYMGYANIPLAVGWGYGSLMGGQIYDKMGDKANLAIRYMQDYMGVAEDVSRNRAFSTLVELSGSSASEVTQLLWQTYHPYQLWYQFVGIGMLSAVGIFIYSRIVRKTEEGV